MPPKDLTVEILKEIRDDARETRRELSARLDAVGVRIGGVADRVDSVADRLDGLATRVVEGEIRTATAMIELHETVRDVASMLRAQHDLRPRVDRCEKDIADLQHQLKSG